MSSLLAEIVEYSGKDEVAVCNLASVSLPKYVRSGIKGTYFDYEDMHRIVKTMVHNLNLVIDRSYYPVVEAKRSNSRHRPIGVGVQGLADVFIMLRMPFESEEAAGVNREIFETIYHAALEASCELAEIHGPYSTFKGSPASQGILQFDMWGVDPGSGRYDWDYLKQRVKLYGIRNSLLVAPMPTASTAQVLGNSEGFEPIQDNMFIRKTLAGEFLVCNKHLVADMLKLGLWSPQLRDAIIKNKGSIQAIEDIPDGIKALYKTAFEIKQRSIIDMAADRGPFICQSQSMNLFLKSPRFDTMSSMLFYAFKRGLKTGQYYLRSLPAADPIAVTVVRQSRVPSFKTEEDSETTCLECSS